MHKYKAYDKETKKIYEVENLYLQDEYVSLVVGEFNEGKTIKRRLRDVILLQFTGLSDKNKKEIYEGDIVKKYTEKTFEPGFDTRVFPVIWDEVEAGFTLNNWPLGIYTGKYGKNKLEIIGNSLEHPDLLTNPTNK